MTRAEDTVLARSLKILLALATRRFGLTLREIMDEGRIPRSSAFRHIRVLESVGVQITRHREPVRSKWTTLYRLAGIRGLRFEIRRSS